MKLDRTLQKQILTLAADCYPAHADSAKFNAIIRPLDVEAVAANLRYLEEHQLIRGGVRIGLNGHISYSPPTLTAQGADFLADDGGLTAILGVITVKLHEDSVRALLLQRVENLPSTTPEERSSLAAAVRNLPARAIQTAADKLIELGVANLPDAAHRLHTWITQIAS